MIFELALSLQLVSSLIMVGLIWVIQLVHYPSFHFINEGRFSKFESFHAKRISLIVVPVMVIELISAFLLLVTNTRALSQILYINMGIVLCLWLYTFFVSARIHQSLSYGYKKDQVILLVKSNWLRTILWTLKIPLLLPLIN